MADNLDAQIADALVGFSSDDRYPESEDVSAAQIDGSALPSAYRALDAAKIALEADIRAISREVAPNVESWMASALALQADIEKSRKLAGDIVRNSEADDDEIDSTQDQEAHLAFLEKETAFNGVLRDVLLSIKRINSMVNDAEELAAQRQNVPSLQMLAESWKLFQSLPAEPDSRVVRLLETRIHTLRKSIHEQFLDVWKALVHFDIEQGSLTINQSIQDEPMDLEEAVLVASSYDELDNLAKQFWEDLDDIIIKPRTDVERGVLYKTKTSENSITSEPVEADLKIKPLFLELEDIIKTLSRRLPADFALLVAERMMPELSNRILELWLDRAVPSSLEHMEAYQKALLRVGDFTNMLISMKWPGSQPLQDWVSNAPKVWLSKKRETALDWTRNQLSLGVGDSVPAQHVETRMVPRDEGLHIGTSGNVINQDGNVANQEWESGWDSDAQDDPIQEETHTPPATNRASLDEEAKFTPTLPSSPHTPAEDDAADAWGWGDEDIPEIEENSTEPVQDTPSPQRPALPRAITPAMREVTLSETYHTSSLPKSFLELITKIYSDAEFLTKNQEIPVAIAAAGLFNLPTLILAMYRAVSPHYYLRDPSGNMFMYNDSIWLCDQFKDYLLEWEGRDDRPKSAYGMVKLDPEIKKLQIFGKRAYTDEMVSQRTIITDLMGGSQSFLDPGNMDSRPVVSHIRSIAAMWKKILPYSAWASAVGQLVNAVASKIISDVFDLTGLDVDEAEATAKLITNISALDDLFIREDPQKHSKNGQLNGEDDGSAAVPLTAQFASNWMKMKFLSEVLQANLKDIRYLWFESHLSLYFTKDETVDLIKLSFEDNPNSRQLIREIKQSTMEMSD